MRVIIVPIDAVVTVDGVSRSGLDMSSIAPEVHAVQWYETYGDVEIKDVETGHIVRNEHIDTLDAYQTVLDLWAAAPANEPAPPVDVIPTVTLPTAEPVPTVTQG